MAQSPTMAGFDEEPSQVPLRRHKKAPGAPYEKNVVVLKHSDVAIRGDTVFMPNTIELARLKKPEKGQFKKMQISSYMLEADVRKALTESFPFLEDKRFYCASAVDNRSRLDFHGDRRIWDGRVIKQKIKGNSALYIFVDEDDPTVSVQEMIDAPTVNSYLGLTPFLFEGVEDAHINPKSGSVEGGYPFHIELYRELSPDIVAGTVEFHGVSYVPANRIMNSSVLTGNVPFSGEVGKVTVTAKSNAGEFLGQTDFTYIIKAPAVVKQLLEDPQTLYLWFLHWADQCGFLENESSIAEYKSLVDVPDQGSYGQKVKHQSVNVLELLLYTAAEEGLRLFVDVLFSTSAGLIVFNSYKSRRLLPEDVAQAKGNHKLAQYLRDINTRLSQETFSDAESNAIDWLELAKAVQQQAAIPSGTAEYQLRGRPRDSADKRSGDNSSEMFVDMSLNASSPDPEDKDLPVLKKFQDDFKRFIVTGGRLSDDEAFKKKNGFTVSDFLQIRRNCAKSLRRIADHIETVTRNTGIAKTTSGLAVIGGILALPFTGGGSFAAVVGGVTGLAGAATSFTAEWFKSDAIKNDSVEVKNFLGDLEKKDTVVNQEVKNLKEKADSMRSAYDNKAVVDWLKDGSAVEEWYAAAGIEVGFQRHGFAVYGSSIMAAHFAKGIARVILADMAVAQGIASGMSGLTPLLGKTLFTAGETTAKVLSRSMALVGIVFALWDIKEGVADIKGSEHATAYRDAAEKIDESTSQYQEMLEQINEMFFSAASPQAH